jgi:hypothetical protein
VKSCLLLLYALFAIALMNRLAEAGAREEPGDRLTPGQSPVTETWSTQRIEAAFHDVLAHGDLSDVDFLSRTLGIELEVIRPEEQAFPMLLGGQSIQARATATKTPSYIAPYNTNYLIAKNAKDGTTHIMFFLEVPSCPDLVPWGKDWNQKVEESNGVSTDDGPTFTNQWILWLQNPQGVTLGRMQSDTCGFTLDQKTTAAVSIPKPAVSMPGPGTALVEQIVRLIVAGDLRDYLKTARIFHIRMSTKGQLRRHQLYEGNVDPAEIIPGTTSGLFMYFVNDAGRIFEPFTGSHGGGPRTVRFWLSIDTRANCISLDRLKSEMHLQHVRFREESGKDFGPYLRTVRKGNSFALGYEMDGPCISMFKLEQQTNYAGVN